DGDIRTLLKGASADERAAAAMKLCHAIQSQPLTAEEQATAAEILRVMAGDVEAICVPMLGCSPAFTDDDLAKIVRLGGPVRQLAVARRPILSRTVTDAIAEHGSGRAVAAACANDNADFAEAALGQVIARFEASERVLQAVAYRKVLPLSVTEKLVSLVSDQVRDHL